MDQPTLPFRLLRLAYQHARDIWQDNADQPETIRDYWPACLEMVFEDARLRWPT